MELQLLVEKWRLMLAGIVFQYLHGLAARGVHYLHRPGPILQDIWLIVLPELGKQWWRRLDDLPGLILGRTFHPFVYHSKGFYTVLIWRRI
ncbi:phosphatidylinositol:ceramide inositolphosphotransferase-like [Zingiber officinale]|uniref:phosphatidylinositol:ceramide inositolphosphotransferase-like n=1 Tax=Zingiber officinale TaxID=94328 RepID=UPI001C4D2AFE|nr:phosphatidylinositol:ceramide inositolphosphotransferase-like [Zingiber officinale]